MRFYVLFMVKDIFYLFYDKLLDTLGKQIYNVNDALADLLQLRGFNYNLLNYKLDNKRIKKYCIILHKCIL